MLTKIKESYRLLLASKEFKHKGFLSGAFVTGNSETLEKEDWQLDFYNKETDTMTAYRVKKEAVEVDEDSSVFRDEEKNVDIEELDLSEIKKDYAAIKELLNTMLEGHRETAVKTSIILQKQNVPIWNIIYITKNFNLLNIKINAKDGSILEDRVINLLSFEKGDYQAPKEIVDS